MPETEHGYYARNDDWPTSGNDLAAGEVFAALDDLDRFHAAALESFKEAPDA